MARRIPRPDRAARYCHHHRRPRKRPDLSRHRPHPRKGAAFCSPSKRSARAWSARNLRGCRRNFGRIFRAAESLANRRFVPGAERLRPDRSRAVKGIELAVKSLMHVPTLIEKKREGQELTKEEIEFLIEGFTLGEIADYQMSAWAMAVFFRGMTAVETQHLTTAMMESGSVLEYPKGSPPKVDKHSTGGIGDKTSLVLAPLLACDENWVPMISGRGLGITGGTLDKLESIPGFNIQIDERRALAQLDSIGVFMIGQSADICPADKKLYALRDVTGTVPSQALIVASIMSKKLAESLDRLVLDVKFGSGAFMKTHAQAEQLAQSMTEVGERMGVRISHLLTRMDEPLGRTVGNALEVAECVDILQGRGPPDIIELTLNLAEQVSTAPRAQLANWLKDGTAWRKFISLGYAQDSY